MKLATCRFIREQRDILFTGPPGVGKSHLAQAIGRQAAKMGHVVMYRSIFETVSELNQAEAFSESDKALRWYLKPDLLIIDDMGLKNLPKQSGEYLFEIIMHRYELRFTVMTSNRPLEEWGKLLGDVPTATAILDHFLSRADGRGRAMDNIFVERLWRTVKYEEVYLKSYETAREARESLARYFHFYNTERLHQALGYRTPQDVYFKERNLRKGSETRTKPMRAPLHHIQPSFLS